MSFIGGGSSNIFIAAGQTQFWTWTWNFLGWSGNTFNQPEPLNTGASLRYSAGSVSRNSNGTFSFSFLNYQ